MRAATSNVVCALATAGLVISGGCGGGSTDSGPTVASVVITSPAVGPAFATVGRTAQFAAVAKDATGATISGATISWQSTSASVATVDGSGLVTATGNGTTSITATSGGVASAGVTVTVQQVAAHLVVNPGAVNFGAIGSTRQLTPSLVDTLGNAMPTPTASYSVTAHGTVTVSGTGLVTSVQTTTPGQADSVLVSVTSGTTNFITPVVVAVNQVTKTITVSSTGIDSLKNTGSLKQYSATAADSNGHAIPGLVFTWSSSSPSVATVNSGSGLATAVADGGTNISATSGSVIGSRGLVVARFAKTFTLSPSTTQSITTAAGTIVFTGTATDSSNTNLTITWTSASTAIVSMSPASGTSPSQSTATGSGNGSANITMATALQSQSVLVNVSGQPTTPTAISVNVGDDFFQGVRNNSNPAVDTVAANGTVTWTWTGLGTHNVTSDNSAFTKSPDQSKNSYQFMFTTPGTYAYHCTFHGGPGTGMHGTLVVK